MSRHAALWLLLPLAACGSAPLSGTWEYTDEEQLENTCSDAIDYDGAEGEFTVVDNGNGTITVDPLDGTDPFDCDLKGSDFDCPERLAEVVDLGGGAEAEIRASAEGTFKGKDKAEGTQTATMTCTNQQCENIAAMVGIPSPCTVKVSFEAEWVGDLEE